MQAERVPIAHVDVREEDIEAVAAVLRSGRLRQGRVVQEFEEALAAKVGSSHAVAVSSGTAALHIAYLALFEPGDEVIVPSFTFAATASMLLAVGAVPVFADVDARTFTLSAESVRSLVTPRTRGVVGVHLFGNPCDVRELQDFATSRGLVQVWDAAQALGSSIDGQDVGGLPVASCYSFYPTKNITTGEGGMVVTDDPTLAARLRLVRSQGAEAKYWHTTLGFNLRLTDFQAALGLRQLERLDEYVRRRRENAAYLDEVLSHTTEFLAPATQKGGQHSFNQYSVLASPFSSRSRDEIVDELGTRGIETAVHYPIALHCQPVFAGFRHAAPVSEELATSIFSLPVHPSLDQQQLARIRSALLDVAGVPARTGGVS